MIAITMIPGATTIMPSVSAFAQHPNNAATRCDQHQQERSPGLREDAPPFNGRIEEVQLGLPLHHTLLLRLVQFPLLSRFHFHLLFNLAPV
jgi:hypothetical protein